MKTESPSLPAYEGLGKKLRQFLRQMKPLEKQNKQKFKPEIVEEKRNRKISKRFCKGRMEKK